MNFELKEHLKITFQYFESFFNMLKYAEMCNKFKKFEQAMSTEHFVINNLQVEL